MTSYQFTREPKQFNDDAIDAQTAGEELARIHAEHGRLTPRAVVDESLPEDAPLHPAFEWRDNVAADEYRQIQARSLIKTVEVIRPAEDEKEPEPVYVKVANSPAQYERSSKVAQTPDMFESAFMLACQRLQSAQKAIEHLQQIAKREQRAEASRYLDAARAVGRIAVLLAKGA